MKLSPLSVPYRAFDNGLRLLFIAVFVGATSGGSIGGYFGAVRMIAVILAILVPTVLGWQLAYVRRFEYELTSETFDIRSGVFSRREREIPYRRIQNVDIRQNPIQRALGLAEVRLETAGGGQTEAQLQYVERSEANRLQEEFRRRKRSEGETTAGPVERAPPIGEELFTITPKELAIVGLVSADFRLLPLILFGMSIVGPPVVERAVAMAITDVAPIFLLGPLIGVSVLLVGGVASGVFAALRYYGFRLTHVEDEYRYERGLVQRFSGTIPAAKVQTITIRENVLARAVGYASLTIETAGYGPNQQGSGSQSQAAVPIARRERVLSLARSIESFGDVSFTRPPRRARRRYAVRYLLALGVVAGLAYGVVRFVGVDAPWYVVLAFVPLVPVAAHYKWKHLGYHVTDDYVLARSGFWTRTIIVVPAYRVQTVHSSQTIFQRWRDLATVVVDTAGAGSLVGNDAKAVDIDATAAESLRETVADNLREALARRRRTGPRSPSNVASEGESRPS